MFMTPTWKRGSTVQILLDQFTDEQWAVIHPWTAARCEARCAIATRNMTITADPATKTIVLSADTADWPARLMKADLLIDRDGRIDYLPAANFFEFLIIQPGTEPA